MTTNNLIPLAFVAAGALLGAAHFLTPTTDVQAEALQAEHARVKALLAQDWEAVRQIAHPDFEHEESNKQRRTIGEFVAAMQWCGKDGKTPGPASEMPKGGGFSFARHDIDWKTVTVFVVPGTESAIVTGKYSNVLRRCFTRPDGTTGVEEPQSAKPATFVRFYEGGKLRWHRALVDTAAPAASMSQHFPPPPQSTR